MRNGGSDSCNNSNNNKRPNTNSDIYELFDAASRLDNVDSHNVAIEMAIEMTLAG